MGKKKHHPGSRQIGKKRHHPRQIESTAWLNQSDTEKYEELTGFFATPEEELRTPGSAGKEVKPPARPKRSPDR